MGSVHSSIKLSATARRRAALLAAVAFFLTVPGVVDAQLNYWLNPAGGNWSDGTNWSNHSTGGSAVFSLGSSSPYTVTHVNINNVVTVANDQVILDLGGQTDDPYYMDQVIVTVDGVAGESNSLTLANGTMQSAVGYNIGGTGGTSTFSLNSFTLKTILEGGYIAFNPGSSNFYNQINSVLQDEFGGSPLVFANTTAVISGGSMTTSGVIFGGPTELMSTTVYAYDGGDINFNGSGTVISSTAGATDALVIGGMRGYDYSYPPDGLLVVPKTGGDNATVTATNSNLNGEYVLVGTSGGTGIFNISGGTSSLSSGELFAVGYSGTGKVAVFDGASLKSAASVIGANGGTGSVTLSGTGTHWVSLGPDSTGADTTLQNGIIQLDTNATWSDVGYKFSTFPIQGGNVNLGSGATLAILSGARAHFSALNEIPGSTLDIGLDGSTAATNGQLIVDDLATFAGTLDVTLENGFEPGIGESFQLFTFGTESGQFATLDLPPGYSWDTSQLYVSGIITAAVPEPSLMGLLAIAATGPMLCRCRRGRLAL